jgi:hypothetical protein
MNWIKIGMIAVLGFGIIVRVGVFRESDSPFLQVLNRYILGNQLVFKCSKEIDPALIRIHEGFGGRLLYEKNRLVNPISDWYGGPFFDVYYNNQLLGMGIHDNTNNWHTNEFTFTFFVNAKEHRPQFTFDSKGKDQGGEKCYIWIRETRDSIFKESYQTNGTFINRWAEAQQVSVQ